MNDLNFEHFMNSIDIDSIVNDIQKYNLQLMNKNNADEYVNYLNAFTELIQVLRVLEVSLKNDSITDDIKLKFITGIITIHQYVMNDVSNQTLPEEILKITRRLVVFYPLLLIGELMSTDTAN